LPPPLFLPDDFFFVAPGFLPAAVRRRDDGFSEAAPGKSMAGFSAVDTGKAGADFFRGDLFGRNSSDFTAVVSDTPGDCSDGLWRGGAFFIGMGRVF